MDKIISSSCENYCKNHFHTTDEALGYCNECHKKSRRKVIISLQSWASMKPVHGAEGPYVQLQDENEVVTDCLKNTHCPPCGWCWMKLGSCREKWCVTLMSWSSSYTCDSAQATITLSCLSLVGFMLLSNYPFSYCFIHVPTVLCVHRCVMLHKQCMIILFYTCSKNAYPLSSPCR